MLFAVVVGVLAGLLIAVPTVSLRLDQIVIGIVFTIFALG